MPGADPFLAMVDGCRDGVVLRGRVWLDEAYKADTKDPACLEWVAMMNNLCSWIERCLWRFAGMEMKSLRSHLNWYAHLFRVKQAKERWPEIARVIRHLLRADAHLRGST